MDVLRKLRKLTEKDNVFLFRSGNEAILNALNAAKKLDKKRVLVQAEGGWLSYLKYPRRLGFDTVKLETRNGLIELEHLEKYAGIDSCLLINSLSGYFAQHPMAGIELICRAKGCLLINDASGSIGTELAKYGDIIVCSFGRWKPIELGYGGMLATNLSLSFKQTFEQSRLSKLSNALRGLRQKLNYWHSLTERIKEELAEFDIVRPEHRGINVVVRFFSEAEKAKLIKYCKDNNYQYTLGPRYIRLCCPCISIEVKRRNINLT